LQTGSKRIETSRIVRIAVTVVNVIGDKVVLLLRTAREARMATATIAVTSVAAAITPSVARERRPR